MSDDRGGNSPLEVHAVDCWTVEFSISLAGETPVSSARTVITQPQGYVHTLLSPVEMIEDRVHWTSTFPLVDEGAYEPRDRRADWEMGEYRFATELLEGDRVVVQAEAAISPLDFMPHTFRGVGPLIGRYSQHLVECAPDRPVYIDIDEMSVSYRAIAEGADECSITMDVVEPGGDEALAGPWELQATGEMARQTFSSAGWPRGEYWVRLRPHRAGEPVGAYMVRAVWKEILPTEKRPERRSLHGLQPLPGPWGFERVENVRFVVDPMQPRPDDWIAEKEKPWESEYLGLKSEAVHYDAEKGQYSLDLSVSDVNIHHPVDPTICRIVSDDGVHWRRPNLGRIEYRGSTENNIVGYAGKDEVGKPSWPLRSIHEGRVEEDPDLLPDLEKLSIRFYDAQRDGPVDPRNCFVKTTGWDLVDLCATVDPQVSAHFDDSVRHPDHIRFQAFAVERRGDALLLLSREPLLRTGSGMDLYHTTESFRYTLEDRSTGTFYYYFRPGAPSYPPHYSPIDNIHQIRRVLAVMWTRDYLHWERRFVLSPDEEDVIGTQFYHIYLHTSPQEAAQSSPGSVLAGLPAVDGGHVYLGSLTYYDARRSQMWPELLWTADFVHWHRFEQRRKLIANSPPGSYSFGAVRHSGIIAEIGDHWWLTFHGYRQPYKYPRTFRYDDSLEEFARKNAQFEYAPDFENWEQFYRFCERQYGINPAIAVAPVGRLAHAESDEVGQAGELVTGLVALTGGALMVNAAVEEGGSLRVELQDEEGRALPGFELEACRPFCGDELRHAVAWEDCELEEKGYRSVRICFSLDRARLYGYWFVHREL